ncbi:MAG: hypothetical protein LBQ12_03775 [Deltaproteobacteria bacterium]|nr:hypothetical protein [Deltaproteobacteria bacterium]
MGERELDPRKSLEALNRDGETLSRVTVLPPQGPYGSLREPFPDGGA